MESKTLDKDQEKSIRKTQAILQQIDQGVKVFFNITQYERLGLTYSTKVWGRDAVGNKVVMKHKHHLTDKGKMIINTVV